MESNRTKDEFGKVCVEPEFLRKKKKGDKMPSSVLVSLWKALKTEKNVVT